MPPKKDQIGSVVVKNTKTTPSKPEKPKQSKQPQNMVQQSEQSYTKTTLNIFQQYVSQNLSTPQLIQKYQLYDLFQTRKQTQLQSAFGQFSFQQQYSFIYTILRTIFKNQMLLPINQFKGSKVSVTLTMFIMLSPQVRQDKKIVAKAAKKCFVMDNVGQQVMNKMITKIPQFVDDFITYVDYQLSINHIIQNYKNAHLRSNIPVHVDNKDKGGNGGNKKNIIRKYCNQLSYCQNCFLLNNDKLVPLGAKQTTLKPSLLNFNGVVCKNQGYIASYPNFNKNQSVESKQKGTQAPVLVCQFCKKRIVEAACVAYNINKQDKQKISSQVQVFIQGTDTTRFVFFIIKFGAGFIYHGIPVLGSCRYVSICLIYSQSQGNRVLIPTASPLFYKMFFMENKKKQTALLKKEYENVYQIGQRLNKKNTNLFLEEERIQRESAYQLCKIIESLISAQQFNWGIPQQKSTKFMLVPDQSQVFAAKQPVGKRYFQQQQDDAFMEIIKKKIKQ